MDHNKDHADISDEALVRCVQRGDIQKFGILVGRYEHKLLRYGRKFLSVDEDREDVVQEIFMRAYEGIQGFDNTLRFSPWIYRIAHNAFINVLRSKQRKPIFFFDLDMFVSQESDESGALYDEEVLKKAIDTGMSQIEEKYREVLILYYLEGMSYRDISDVLQVPINTVGVRLARARAALKECIDPSLYSL